MNNVFRLDNEVVLITGGATGLGRGIAECMHSAGATVVIVGTREEVLAQAAQEIGSRCYYRRFDVTQTQQTTAFIEEINASIGDISVLVNNAGVHCKKPVEEMEDDDFRRLFDVHIMGAFALCRAVVPTMKKNGKGSIIMQSSMTGFIGQPYVVAYSCMKSGYLGMTRTLASELAGDGIRVNAIAPGWIDSPMLRKAIEGDDERKNKILERTPMKKFGRPEDIGYAAVYLASEAAAFVNGVTLPVDGGALIGF